jgi:excisionase family DNA binding protein
VKRKTVLPEISRLREQELARLREKYPELVCLTPLECAAWLRVDVTTLLRAAKKGQIPHVRVGRQFRFNESAVREYLKGPGGKALGL